MTRFLATLLTAGTLFTANASASSLVFAAPSTYDVQLIAGEGRYDGTADAMWVRVHSDALNTWSGWRPVAGGIERGELRSVQFSLSAGFGDVDQVDVYVGASDGARISVLVDDGTVSTLFTPDSRWIKGRTGQFDSAWADGVTCCTDPTGAHGCGSFPGDACPDGLTICWGDCQPED